MNDQLQMFEPTTSEALPNATSSPASGSGLTPYVKRSGLMFGPYGLALARANPSPPQGARVDSVMSAISGRTGRGSLASASLSLSLANRLQARTDLLGSTLFALTWKQRVTPSGRSIPALRASGHRISDRGFTSWPTPKGPHGCGPSDGVTRGITPEGAARLASWPTPQTADTGVSETARQGGENLSVLATWATPTTRDYKDMDRTDTYQTTLHETRRDAQYERDIHDYLRDAKFVICRVEVRESLKRNDDAKRKAR